MDGISFVHQADGAIPIVDVDNTCCNVAADNNVERTKKHGKLLPDSIRALFVGSSGCGKTNAMLTLLYSRQGLAFKNIYIYSKSLFQPKYKQLAQVMQLASEIGYYPYSDTSKVIKPADAKDHSIFIFDDVACEPQSVIREYYSFARHKSIDTFYLIQSYTKAPKVLVRDNVNFLLLFPQDRHNLKYAYNEHVNTDMSFDKFLKLCKICWNNNPHGCLLIDKTSPLENGRYRRGFDDYIVLKNEHEGTFI
jgi:hypothetical protein